MTGRSPEYHGRSNDRTYRAWAAMVHRCTNPANSRWEAYGGRGITVCHTWENSFLLFLADMGDAPEGLSLERRDNDKGYSPDNCYWATAKEQANNRRKAAVRSDNKTGVPGVSWDATRAAYKVDIKVGATRRALGRFADLFEAFCARKSAEVKFSNPRS